MSFSRILSVAILTLSVAGMFTACGPKTRNTRTRIAGPTGKVTPNKSRMTQETIIEMERNKKNRIELQNETTKKFDVTELTNLNLNLNDFALELVVSDGNSDFTVAFQLPESFNAEEFLKADNFDEKIPLKRLKGPSDIQATLEVNKVSVNQIDVTINRIVDDKILNTVTLSAIDSTAVVELAYEAPSNVSVENANDPAIELIKLLDQKITSLQILELSTHPGKSIINLKIKDENKKDLMRIKGESGLDMKILTKSAEVKKVLSNISKLTRPESKSLRNLLSDKDTIILEVGEAKIVMNIFVELTNPNLTEVKVDDTRLYPVDTSLQDKINNQVNNNFADKVVANAEAQDGRKLGLNPTHDPNLANAEELLNKLAVETDLKSRDDILKQLEEQNIDQSYVEEFYRTNETLGLDTDGYDTLTGNTSPNGDNSSNSSVGAAAH